MGLEYNCSRVQYNAYEEGLPILYDYVSLSVVENCRLRISSAGTGQDQTLQIIYRPGF
jgi:hypothetical protein